MPISSLLQAYSQDKEGKRKVAYPTTGYGVLEDSIGEFKDSLEDFRIVMGGFEIDSMIPENVRTKYFNLCNFYNDFLHRNYNTRGTEELAVAIISDIVKISDEVRAPKLTTPLDKFKEWDKTLEAFEVAGMAVGFIRERISELMALFSELSEMKAKRAELEEERRRLQAKLANDRVKLHRLDTEIMDLLGFKASSSS